MDICEHDYNSVIDNEANDDIEAGNVHDDCDDPRPTNDLLEMETTLSSSPATTTTLLVASNDHHSHDDDDQIAIVVVHEHNEDVEEDQLSESMYQGNLNANIEASSSQIMKLEPSSFQEMRHHPNENVRDDVKILSNHLTENDVDEENLEDDHDQHTGVDDEYYSKRRLIVNVCSIIVLQTSTQLPFLLARESKAELVH
jgi:hypothetical protein